VACADVRNLDHRLWAANCGEGALGIVTVGGVERRIDLSNLDLDRAAEMVAARCAGWRERGLMAAELTWMDNDVSWPAPLLRDRGQASRPMSLGVRVHGDAGEAEFGVAPWGRTP
jgi:hypothetical protein